MTTELRRDFHDRLARLHERVEGMGHVVVDGIADATAALLAGDELLADRVMAADAEIDRAYPVVESEIFDIVATQSPVARDLRLVIATFRVAANIERCGDLVSSIARRASRLERGALDGDARTLLETMGRAVGASFGRAMQAYAVLDDGLASSVGDLDHEVDDLQRRLLRHLVGAATDTESAIDLALVARFYERIGDHAVVIAERVRFVASGQMDPGDRDEQPTG